MSSPVTRIHTSQDSERPNLLDSICIPQVHSHKGENGRLLLVGGSHSFHAASLWAAETASHIVDIVHYASTKENNQILLSLRKKFRNGIVVAQQDIPSYIEEDDAILIGPGMERGSLRPDLPDPSELAYEHIVSVEDEAQFTHQFIGYVLHTYPGKKFVFDAAGLQMLNREWFHKLHYKPILTPHQREFEIVFGISVESRSVEEKVRIAQDAARKYNCVILLKAITDIITDGDKTYLIEGGNQGLTKGGTGDVLSGLTGALYAKNDPLTAAVSASYILKKTADTLYETHGYWYNVKHVIDSIPRTLTILLL